MDHRWSRELPSCEVLDLDGVSLIALDNSAYQVSRLQVEIVRRHVEAGLCLLFMHIIEEDILTGMFSFFWTAIEVYNCIHMCLRNFCGA